MAGRRVGGILQFVAGMVLTEKWNGCKMVVFRSNGIEREFLFFSTRFLTNSITLLGTKSACFPLRLAPPFDLNNQTRKAGTLFVMPERGI